MKKIIVVCLIIFFSFAFIGCGEIKTIDGVTYDIYGLANSGEKRNPDIEYKIIIGNVIWSCVLVETIVAPIYFLGFSLYEPICKKRKGQKPGVINSTD